MTARDLSAPVRVCTRPQRRRWNGPGDATPVRPPRTPGLVATVLALAVSACGTPQGALDPRSDAAAGIEALWWVLFGVCTAVFVVVLALYARAVWGGRGGRDARASGDGGADRVEHASREWDPDDVPEESDEGEAGRGMVRLVVIGGGVIPGLILLGLTAATIRTSTRVHHAGPGGGGEPVEIHVIGHQFWWEVRYPGTDVVTANEIHVPVGRPARLVLASGDVIHSLWVPQLHGKIDLTPGRETELVLAPVEPGAYRGFCTEFCGAQHALMGLLVVAQPEAEFEAWLAEQARPAEPPTESTAATGSAVFAAQGCTFCHRVRGGGFRGPAADVGPDLTHVASRRTLGAATLPNGPASLAAWVLDPHAIKPGVRMPATPLAADELRALTAYLETLR